MSLFGDVVSNTNQSDSFMQSGGNLRDAASSLQRGDFSGALQSGGRGIAQAAGYGDAYDAAEGLVEGASGSLSNLDPTVVRKTDTSRVKGVSEEAARRAQQMFDQPVERYQVSDIGVDPIGDLQGRQDLQAILGQARDYIGEAGQIDPSVAQFLQASTQQGQLDPAVALARQAALGEGPSAAQSQLQAGLDASIAAQMAGAASGGGGAAALRGAQQQAATMQQQTANQAAALRAQEMAQARALYGDLAGQQAAQQIGALQGAAGLQLSADELSGAQQQAAINAALQGSQAAAGLDLQQAQFNQQQALEAQRLQEMLGMQALQQQQATQLGFGQLGAGLLGQQGGTEQFLAALEADRLGQIGALRGQAFGAGVGAVGDILSSAIASGGQAAGGAGSAAAAAPAAAAMVPPSDENLKTNIKPNEQTLEFLNALTDNEYEYKNPEIPGARAGRNFGPMAQDLEKTEMGRTIVIDSEDGKRVDSGRGFLLALAGLSNINERLKKLEA